MVATPFNNGENKTLNALFEALSKVTSNLAISPSETIESLIIIFGFIISKVFLYSVLGFSSLKSFTVSLRSATTFPSKLFLSTTLI